MFNSQDFLLFFEEAIDGFDVQILNSFFQFPRFICLGFQAIPLVFPARKIYKTANIFLNGTLLFISEQPDQP